MDNHTRDAEIFQLLRKHLESLGFIVQSIGSIMRTVGTLVNCTRCMVYLATKKGRRPAPRSLGSITVEKDKILLIRMRNPESIAAGKIERYEYDVFDPNSFVALVDQLNCMARKLELK